MNNIYRQLGVITITLLGITLASTRLSLSAQLLVKNKTLLAQNSQQIELLNGTWKGKYKCGQGITSLKLEINAKSPTDIKAVFNFSPHYRNPFADSGAFRMQGTYQTFKSSSQPNVLKLKPTTWITKPLNYTAVGLESNVNFSERTMIGKVIGQGCGDLELKKVDDKLSYKIRSSTD